ncbi:hypothetical protein [Methanobacterium subterraneum]|jgi:hypothetical protein|uniref:Uncharacterized protein n=1 Tax=Methanobacterium subterraneum TaxID=59277 RepID=A0A2H4VBP8_9EURY|nr:hypothetical protein [Methanobacterium subterraneum]AUB55511.1 hypothetical protein BK007_05430 [Methanobacterium subterraneum]MBW4258433.1 hypothetical protein [Methanobacterium sp. YSL]NMO08347.1 hypothetical protein [Methanobacterium subterraneum]PKL71483.1 MAG: hypothetical protein CVV29_10380 [Methanobacteriales archaeon HGW-Methanobacteriales-2]
MKAKKLKMEIKTSKFSFPIPALRFSTLKWISKLVLKYGPSKIKNDWLSPGEHQNMSEIIKNLTPEDVEGILNKLEQEEPFELVNIDTYDENQEKVVVKIYTV